MTGRILAIASGKGGVGKTFLAITLAHALARAGARVLLFDADFGLANVDVQLGLMPDRDLEWLLAGRATLAETAIPHPAGFAILAGRSGSGTLATLDPAAQGRIAQALRDARAAYDHVILDCGAGLDRPVRRLAATADRLLVVATDEPTSLTDAYAVLKLHTADGGQNPWIAVNQAASHAAGARTHATLARACRSFLGHSPAHAGTIRRDPHVPESIRRQALLLTRHPTSPAAADVEALAHTFLSELVEA